MWTGVCTAETLADTQLIRRAGEDKLSTPLPPGGGTPTALLSKLFTGCMSITPPSRLRELHCTFFPRSLNTSLSLSLPLLGFLQVLYPLVVNRTKRDAVTEATGEID